MKPKQYQGRNDKGKRSADKHPGRNPTIVIQESQLQDKCNEQESQGNQAWDEKDNHEISDHPVSPAMAATSLHSILRIVNIHSTHCTRKSDHLAMPTVAILQPVFT
jgi:hypothetical protein